MVDRLLGLFLLVCFYTAPSWTASGGQLPDEIAAPTNVYYITTESPSSFSWKVFVPVVIGVVVVIAGVAIVIVLCRKRLRHPRGDVEQPAESEMEATTAETGTIEYETTMTEKSDEE